MGDVLNVTVTNNSKFGLALSASADWTMNWSGHLDGQKLAPGDSLSVKCEKDDLFKGGGVFGHSQIRLTFMLSDPLVIQNGPVTTTYPPVPVAKVQYDDATWQPWTGGGYALAMSAPYSQLQLAFTISNDTSTITLS